MYSVWYTHAYFYVSGMMFLHFQRQRQNKEKHTQQKTKQKQEDDHLDICNRLVTNRIIFVCLSVGGFLFFLHGVVFFAVGLKNNSSVLLVSGPVCIVVGVLILLFCFDIIIFLKKISVVRNNEESNPSSSKKWGTKIRRKIWNGGKKIEVINSEYHTSVWNPYAI